MLSAGAPVSFTAGICALESSPVRITIYVQMLIPRPPRLRLGSPGAFHLRVTPAQKTRRGSNWPFWRVKIYNGSIKGPFRLLP